MVTLEKKVLGGESDGSGAGDKKKKLKRKRRGGGGLERVWAKRVE